MNRMSEEEVRFITQCLEKGRSLPDSYRYLIPFETKKEYELTYADKEREEDILADTMIVPLQPVKTFGNGGNGWTNVLIFGDNLQVLKTLWRMKEEGKLKNADGTSGVRLIYIDPPFATRQEFRGSREEKAYQDKIVGAQFLEFLRKRLIFLKELLTEDGSIYIHLDWKKGDYIKVLLDELFNDSNFRNDIIWTYNGKGLTNPKKNFVRYYAHIYFYANSESTKFDNRGTKISESVIGRFGRYFNEYNQITFKTLKENNEKAEYDKAFKKFVSKFGKKPEGDDIAVDYNQGALLKDIWDDIPIVREHPKYKEYVGYPTQKPEALLGRIIKASSNKGDIVLDCFAGSGTTGAVAEKLGRRWVMIDCGKLAIYTMQKRLLNLREEIGNRGKPLKAKPFTLCNAGLYDYRMVKELPWEQYRDFVLKLFQCRDERHRISGLELDGYLGADDVLVFNYQTHEDAVLGREFIDDLHSILGEKIGRRFFIIAPAASVVFLEDYIEKGETKYFVLRVPYSIIDELHRKGFSHIKQPISEMDINNTVDAVGFDFIQIPEVECEYFFRDKEAVIKIKRFLSNIISKKPQQFENWETLSMAMVDYDYDGEVFNFDEVFYAEDLKKQNYEIRFDSAKIDGQMMIIYIDIFGNEKREVKRLMDFTKA